MSRSISQPSDLKTSSDNAAPRAARSILIVDDNAENRDSLSRRLQKRGYETILAADGMTALQILEKSPCDLVLLDVMMPGMNGVEVLQKIRQTHSAMQLPVIMVTARDQSGDIAEALNLGATDYVTKPLDFVVLLARIQTHLNLKASSEDVLALQVRLSERNRELEQMNGRLNFANGRMRRDLQAAARVQEAFLPKTDPHMPSLDFAWSFKPCEQLAGDFLNICPLDDEHVALYVMDVSGHGVAAALLAMAAVRSLSSPRDPDSLLMRISPQSQLPEPAPPAQVAERLNQKFAWDANTEQFLTIFYALVNAKTRRLTYISAGHPGAVWVPRNRPAVILDQGGLPISIGNNYEQYTVDLSPGDRIYLYSDGVTEAMNASRELFGQKRLLTVLEKLTSSTLSKSVADLNEEIRRWRGNAPMKDDVSILAMECLPE